MKTQKFHQFNKLLEKVEGSEQQIKLSVINTLKKDLEKFGTLVQCEEEGNKFHVKITKGFNMNAMNTFKCMKVVCDAVANKFPNIDKYTTDKNLFHLILKKGETK